MITDSNLDTHITSFTAANGPALLTEDEIAAVGGGITDRDVAPLEVFAGVQVAGAGVGLGGAMAAGFVLATAPVWVGGVAFAGCALLLAGGVLLAADGIRRSMS